MKCSWWMPNSTFFNFEDRGECYKLNCIYFEWQIHWCTQNHLWTSSFMHQEGSIKNLERLSKLLLSIIEHTLISLRWVKGSTWILFQIKSIFKEIILEPFGVPDLHPRSQECPPKSESFPDGCQIPLFEFWR